MRNRTTIWSWSASRMWCSQIELGSSIEIFLQNRGFKLMTVAEEAVFHRLEMVFLR